MKAALRLLVLALVAALGGCAVGPAGQRAADAPTTAAKVDDPNDFGTPGNPDGYSHVKSAAATCNCLAEHAEKALAEAIADVAGKHVSRPHDVNGALTCAMVGSKGAIPSVMIPDTSGGNWRPAGELVTKAKARALELTIDDHGRMTVAPASSVEATALQRTASSVSTAIREATAAEQTCSALALGVATSLSNLENTRDVNSGLRDLHGYVALERARLWRLVGASKRTDVAAAGATALAAALRSSVQTGTAKPIESTSRAIGDALSTPTPPPDASSLEADVAALLAQADKESAEIRKHAKEWAKQHAVSTGHGGANGVAAEPVMKDAGSTDAGAVAGALMGLFQGDVGAIVRGAAVLFPKDSPIRSGLDATGSLLKGDIVGAVRSASKMVPKDTAMGQALATANGRFETANQLRRGG